MEILEHKKQAEDEQNKPVAENLEQRANYQEYFPRNVTCSQVGSYLKELNLTCAKIQYKLATQKAESITYVEKIPDDLQEFEAMWDAKVFEEKIVDEYDMVQNPDKPADADGFIHVAEDDFDLEEAPVTWDFTKVVQPSPNPQNFLPPPPNFFPSPVNFQQGFLDASYIIADPSQDGDYENQVASFDFDSIEAVSQSYQMQNPIESQSPIESRIRKLTQVGRIKERDGDVLISLLGTEKEEEISLVHESFLEDDEDFVDNLQVILEDHR